MNGIHIFGGWWQVDRSNALESEPLNRLVGLWRDKYDGEHLPSRRDFDSETLLSFGGRIALIEVEANPRRYRYRLVGTQITGAVGRDSTGRYFDDLYDSEYYRRMAEHFEEIIETKKAIRTVGNMAHSEKPYISVEGIDMPLADDGKTVDMILRALEFGTA